MQGWMIDLIALAIILLFGTIGIIKGFFKSILSFFGLFGSLAVAIIFRQYAVNLFDTLFGLNAKLTEVISAKLGEFSPELTSNVQSSIEGLAGVIQGTDLNTILKGVFTSLLQNVTVVDPVTVAEVIAPKIAYGCSVVISIIAMFIVVRIIVLLLNLVLGKLAKGKVVGGINKTFGFLFGLVKGVVAVFGIMAIMSVACLLPAVNEKVSTLMENTIVVKYGYNAVNNYIVEKIGGITITTEEEQTEEPPVEEQGQEA